MRLYITNIKKKRTKNIIKELGLTCGITLSIIFWDNYGIEIWDKKN